MLARLAAGRRHLHLHPRAAPAYSSSAAAAPASASVLPDTLDRGSDAYARNAAAVAALLADLRARVSQVPCPPLARSLALPAPLLLSPD